jgi:hypothetical protein
LELFDQVYAAGNTNNGISGAYLDLGTSAAASDGQVTVVNTSPFVGNEEAVTNEDFIVRVSKGHSITITGEYKLWLYHDHN